MCGIAGAYHFRSAPPGAEVLARMAASLAHRGPDDEGQVVLGSCGLANRRLKIIDLSACGHQPMSNPSGTAWLVFNGEIYNHLELKAELGALGRHCIGRSDTEVILHAYDEWGTNCFARFNGMWALALYDTRDGSLVLSRDRWGVKPLYVYRDAERLVFGSEVKALLAHPDVPRGPNLQTVYNYVARHYRWVDGGSETFFDRVENFPPAQYWKFDRTGRVVARERYWALDPSRQDSGSPDDEVIERFRGLFEDAVRVRLRSDVPLACLLSGGLDSSSVTCVAARLTGRPVTTFSARYAEKEFDEGPYIDATTRHIAADARHIYPRPGNLLETLEDMLAYHDEPVCTVTWFAHWLVMKEVAGSGFPVLLNGHGGDELFAGYWDHYLSNFADLEGTDPARFSAEYRCWLANHRRDPAEYQRFKSDLDLLASHRTTDADLVTHYAAAVNGDFQAAAAGLPERPNPFAARGRLPAKLYRDLAYETVPATLRPEDRNSMAFSIESRSPFLDYRLAEFAFSLPNHFKIRGGLCKWILREGMKGILPEPVRTRVDKQGFNAPTVHWFRADNRAQVREVLASRSLAERGILDRAEVLRLFDEHVGGGANHYMAIWQWLNLELWMRRTFDSVPQPSAA